MTPDLVAACQLWCSISQASAAGKADLWMQQSYLAICLSHYVLCNICRIEVGFFIIHDWAQCCALWLEFTFRLDQEVWCQRMQQSSSAWLNDWKQTGCLRFIEFLAWTVAHDAQHFVHLLLLGYCILVAVFTEIPGSDQSLCPCAWHRRHLGAVSLEPATARLSS